MLMIGYLIAPEAGGCSADCCRDLRGNISLDPAAQCHDVSFFYLSRKFLSNTYALHAGYNGLAEANNLIILYPQVQTSTLNPSGCWDW